MTGALVDATEGGLLRAIVMDFLWQGASEPYSLRPEAPDALSAGVAIVAALGELREELEDVALFCYRLEGRGDSPTAAAEIRRLLAANESVAAALGLSGRSSPEVELRGIGKRAARRQGPDSAHRRTVAHLGPRAVITA